MRGKTTHEAINGRQDESIRLVVGSSAALTAAIWRPVEPGLTFVEAAAALLCVAAVATHITVQYRPSHRVATIAAVLLAVVTAVAAGAALVGMALVWAADSEPWPRLVTVAFALFTTASTMRQFAEAGAS